MSDRMVVSVWRLVKTLRMVCASFCLACAWCHFELSFLCSFHRFTRASIWVRGCIYF